MSLKSTAKSAMMMAALVGMIGSGGLPSDNSSSAEDVSVVKHDKEKPWFKIQLTKAQRKGKTVEEVRALKKAIWEQNNLPKSLPEEENFGL